MEGKQINSKLFDRFGIRVEKTVETFSNWNIYRIKSQICIRFPFSQWLRLSCQSLNLSIIESILGCFHKANRLVSQFSYDSFNILNIKNIQNKLNDPDSETNLIYLMQKEITLVPDAHTFWNHVKRIKYYKIIELYSRHHNTYCANEMVAIDIQWSFFKRTILWNEWLVHARIWMYCIQVFLKMNHLSFVDQSECDRVVPFKENSLYNHIIIYTCMWLT